MKGVILFGDSVFVGVGASRRTLSCGKLLQSMVRVPVLIRARSNENTRDGLVRLQEEVVADQRYSHVVILFGNNDCRLVKTNTPAVPLFEFKANLSAMIERILSSGKVPLISNLHLLDLMAACQTLADLKVFATAEFDISKWQQKYSDCCELIADHHNIPLINIRERLGTAQIPVVASDGLHPNDAGHQIIAQELCRVVVASEAPSPSPIPGQASPPTP